MAGVTAARAGLLLALLCAPAAAEETGAVPARAGWIVVRDQEGIRAVRADGGRVVPGRDPRRGTVSPSSAYRAHLIQHPTGRARLLVRRKTGGLVADTWVGPGLLAWSPDDRHLIVRSEGDDGLMLLDTDSGAWRRLTSDSGPLWDAEVAWAPDGGRVAVVSRAPGRRAASLISLDGTRTDLTHLGVPTSIAWTPDGRLLVSAEAEDLSRCLAVLPDGRSSVLAEETGVRFISPTPLVGGVLLVRRSSLGDRVLVADSDALRSVSPVFGRAGEAVLSPDRTAAAFLVEGRRGPEVWILSPATPAARVWVGEGDAEILGWTLDEPPEPRGLTDYNYVHGP